MPYTPDIPIYYADATTPFDPVAISQARATSVEAQLGMRANYAYRWENQGERDRQIGVRDGDRGFQVDSGTLFVRTGGVWTPQQFASDTGWITDAFILRAGFTLFNGSPGDSRLRVKDGIVYIRLHIGGTFPSGSYVEFADYDPNFLPPRIWDCQGTATSQHPTAFRFRETGVVYARHNSGANRSWVAVDAFYPWEAPAS